MIEFMSKKKSLVIYTMFLIVLIYVLKIANTSYGMDTNWFIQNPSGYMNYWINRTTLEQKNIDFGIEVIDNMIIVKVTPNL
ncbi:hypothetical protein GPU26_03375 [Streptococcus thermophilus]|nr:hypothetical protein [Streptococcus thermophilus]MCE2105060.1 hypothetical protein [Streptococcus thermophilus]